MLDKILDHLSLLIATLCVAAAVAFMFARAAASMEADDSNFLNLVWETNTVQIEKD